MSEAKKWDLPIESIRQAGEDFCWITMIAPGEWDSRPGQFVNIRCDEAVEEIDAERPLELREEGPWPRARGAELGGVTPLVRRPVSISDLRTRPDGRREIVLLLRIVGPGSRILGAKRRGDRLDLIGPIGNGFDLDTPGDRALLVGGGCGIAPLVGLGHSLTERGKRVTVFYGCRDDRTMPLTLPAGAGATGTPLKPLRGVAEFGPDTPVVISTDNGSLGIKGLVTDAIIAHAAETGWDGVSIFGCGPDVMMSALAALAALNNVERVQVSLENYMGCAIGVCLSCAARIRDGSERGWTHKFVCQDGPVFEASRVIFENKWEGCKR